mgnify:CR=1 FL=1
MKFTKGYWMNLPGVTNTDAVQVREVKAENDRVYLYTVPYHADMRAMGGPLLEMYISSPQPDIIRTEAYHFMGSNQKMPAFELNDAHCALEVENTETTVTIKSGNTKLVIGKNPCSFDYYYKDKKLTSIGNRFGNAMISTISTPDGNYMRAQMNLDIGEKVYGLGERFTPYVKNGQTVETWNEDGGTCTEISYKSIPFYITNRNYGVLVNDPGPVSYEICSEHVTRVQFSVPGEKLDFMVVGGDSMKNVLENYTTLSGKPALPPAWTFGLWLTSSFTTKYDEETVMGFVNGMKERHIPLHVFHFDCYWMKENEWCNFDWDRAMFPDIEHQLQVMKHENNLKICVWINTYIGQKSPLFKEAKELGYLLKKPNGDVWQWDLWQAGMGIVDFTNPGAWKWYQSKLRHLLDQGVDCFKTDFGERIPSEGVVYHDGSDPKKMHNYYTYLYNKCVYELLERKRGKGQAVLFARSATVGGQKFPVHWGGDCWSDYESMEESLRGGLSLLMSGFGFWAHDIGGFENTSTADVYKRWVAFGLLSSHSRLHGSSSYRVPWVYDDEAVDVVRFFTRLKARLMPYLYKTAIETSVTGVPTMRSMVLEYTEDKTCHYVDKQYMLGDNLLVAPIFNDQSMAEYYLPKGTWTDFFTGEEKEGCGWITEKHGYLSIPLMVKENSIVAIGAHDDKPDYDYGDGAELRLYALKDGRNAEAVVYGMDQKEEIAMTAKREGNQIHITVKSDRNYAVRLVNVAAASVSAGDVKTEGRDTVISLSGSAEVTVTL